MSTSQKIYLFPLLAMTHHKHHQKKDTDLSDLASGAAHKAAGSVHHGMGHVMGDEKMKEEGKAHEAMGEERMRNA